MSQFLEYTKMLYSRPEAELQSKLTITRLNVMPELSVLSSIVRSVVLYQSLIVLNRPS